MIGVDMVTVVTWSVNSGQISIEVLIESLQQVVPPHSAHTLHTHTVHRAPTHTYMYIVHVLHADISGSITITI